MHEHIIHSHPLYGSLVEDNETSLYVPSAAYEEPDYNGDLQTPDDRQHIVTVGDAIKIGNFTVYKD